MGVNNSPPILIHPTQDKAQMASYINENFRKISDGFNPFQMSDGTNNIINIGKDSVGNYTLKVSQPGFNAFDAADSNLIFNSSQNIFKIVDTGTFTLTQPANTPNYTVTIAHGLGFVPGYMAYIEDDGTFFQLPYIVSNPTTSALTLLTKIGAYTDDTNIVFYVNTPITFTTHTWNVKYYLLQETAN